MKNVFVVVVVFSFGTVDTVYAPELEISLPSVLDTISHLTERYLTHFSDSLRFGISRAAPEQKSTGNERSVKTTWKSTSVTRAAALFLFGWTFLKPHS